MSRWTKSWEDASATARWCWVIAGVLLVKTLATPVSHRLSPDIGSFDDEREQPGQVVGFHYEKKSWWGFRKQRFDEIRFVDGRGPQYFDEDAQRWVDVPPEAWGERHVDYRDMEVDNRGWHER